MRMIRKPVRHDSKARVLSNKGDLDYDFLIRAHGKEYYNDCGIFPAPIYDMHNIDILIYDFDFDGKDTYYKMVHGSDYIRSKTPYYEWNKYDPSSDYVTLDKDENFLSIRATYLNDFIETNIYQNGEENFINWCKDRGYLDFA